MMTKTLKNLFDRLQEEHDRWILWVPVLWGLGIAWGLMTPQVPSIPMLSVLGSIIAVAGAMMILKPHITWPWVLGCHSAVWLLSGLVWSTLYVEHLNPTPLLLQPTRPVWLEGRIAHAEQRPYGFRLLVDQVRLPPDLSDLFLLEKPLKPHHHIALLFKQAFTPEERAFLCPGTLIRHLAVLLPWSGPSIPGGYHPARAAAFQGCMAHGYGLEKPQVLEPPPQTTLSTVRHRLTIFLEDRLSPQATPIAQALTTGERGGISALIRDQYANTGLAHLLAISGLHMSLVMGIGFTLGRRLLSLWPSLTCRYDTKRWAVVPGLLLGGFYLLVSGAALPAQRAFMMGLLVFGALALHREPLSMRSLACAAFVILGVHPPALLNVSFQLSFAAVLGLIAWYEHTRNRPSSSRGPFLRYLGQSLATSGIATCATAPLIMFTFNRFTLHSLTANMLAVPLTCFVIVPLGMICLALAACGIPLSLPWKAWDHSIQVLNTLAATISTWPGSEILGATPSWSIQISFVLGGLWLLLWRTSWRWWGFIPWVGGCLVYIMTPHPCFLIDPSGQTIGFYEEDTLYLSPLRARRLRQVWAQSLGTRNVTSSPLRYGQEGHYTRGEYTLRHRLLASGWVWELIQHASQDPHLCYTIQPQDIQTLGAHSVTLDRSSWHVNTAYSPWGKRYWDL